MATEGHPEEDEAQEAEEDVDGVAWNDEDELLHLHCTSRLDDSHHFL